MVTKLEDWFYKQSVQKRLVYIGFLFVFVAIFALNYFYPLYADDMLYSVIKFQEPVNLGENLKEIAEFMHYYYFNWGGRVVAHVAAHLVLMLPMGLQVLVNSLVFCLLIYLVYKIATTNHKANIFVFALIAISIFYFTPAFLSSAVWRTGSVNYLWTATFTLALIYPYYRYVNGYKYEDSMLKSVLFLLFGILAAWSNENSGPTLFLLVVALLCFIRFYKKRQIPTWAIAGLVGVIIGCCLMILAPGNAVRAESEGYEGLFSSFSRMVDRLPYIYGSYRYFLLRPFILYLACVVLQHFFAKDKARRKETLLYSLMFLVIANLSLWVTVLAPSFPPRAFFIITVLTIVAIAVLYANIDFSKLVPKVANWVLLLALIFYASIDYVMFLKGLYFIDKQITKREIAISECIKDGKNRISFEQIHMDYRFEYNDFSNFYKEYYLIDVDFVDTLENK